MVKVRISKIKFEESLKCVDLVGVTLCDLFNLLTKVMHCGTDGTLEMHPGILDQPVTPHKGNPFKSYFTHELKALFHYYHVLAYFFVFQFQVRMG